MVNFRPTFYTTNYQEVQADKFERERSFQGGSPKLRRYSAVQILTYSYWYFI